MEPLNIFNTLQDIINIIQNQYRFSYFKFSDIWSSQSHNAELIFTK